MLDGLDSIPWSHLTHAYGSAGDLPELLRQLSTAPAGVVGEESPLWCLCGNIWHQGTVYEATAYAVPFLIELASHKSTPDRKGILELLAAIANGSSYRAVHGNRLHEPDFEDKKSHELEWAANAHVAVAAGVNALLAITDEETEIRLAALHVLAQLPEHCEIVGPLLRNRLDAETESLQRAGLLLLLGKAGNLSDATLSVLTTALISGDPPQRRAAALAIGQLRPQPLPNIAREVILEAIAADDLAGSFKGLPWDVEAEIDQERMRAYLDARMQD